MLVGELHGGWKMITSQLNHERLGLGTWSDKVVALFRRVYLWARARDEQGHRAMDKAWVRSSLAECYARLEAMRLINMRIAADLERERMDVALSSTTKVFGSESAIEILRKLAAILGANGSMRSGSAATLLQGELEYELRSSVTLTFGGGTNEIQRELIAQFGLGMPRTQR
ncbi:Acyl-CoA dehydrogenase FadE26 [compost metagenome]